ncbi:hypothetical protein VNO77_17532 [Canavalia gladiata]|uniref:Uncharacterized protein n=1 Tax=Canavalia gladiata TaxID=3824 RepID=A0AAN9QMT0_CANGL
MHATEHKHILYVFKFKCFYLCIVLYSHLTFLILTGFECLDIFIGSVGMVMTEKGGRNDLLLLKMFTRIRLTTLLKLSDGEATTVSLDQNEEKKQQKN